SRGARPDVSSHPRAHPSMPGTRGFLLLDRKTMIATSEDVARTELRKGRHPVAAQVAESGLTGAQSLVRSLEELGVEVVFGIPGGAILPAYDPLFDSK